MQLIYPNDPRCWLLIPHVWLLKASFLMVKSHLYIPWVFPNDPQSFSNMNEWIMSVMSCDFPIFSIAITKKVLISDDFPHDFHRGIKVRKLRYQRGCKGSEAWIGIGRGSFSVEKIVESLELVGFFIQMMNWWFFSPKWWWNWWKKITQMMVMTNLILSILKSVIELKNQQHGQITSTGGSTATSSIGC